MNQEFPPLLMDCPECKGTRERPDLIDSRHPNYVPRCEDCKLYEGKVPTPFGDAVEEMVWTLISDRLSRARL